MSSRAKQAAKKVLENFGNKLPIDVEKLATSSLGIPVERQIYDDDVSGMLVMKEGKAIISINKGHHKNRQRFSIAHELGHYFLHRNASDVFIDKSMVFLRDKSSSDGSQMQEIEANNFAAELLMPEEKLKEKIRKTPIHLDNEIDAVAKLNKLAKQFKVSTQALTIRLTRLGLISV